MNLLAIFVAAASLAGPKHVAPSMPPLPLNGYIPVVQTSPPTPGLEFPPPGKPVPPPQMVGNRMKVTIQAGSQIFIKTHANYSLLIDVNTGGDDYKDARGMFSLTYGAPYSAAIGNGVDTSAIQFGWRDTDCDRGTAASGRKMTLLLDKGHKYRLILKFSGTPDVDGNPGDDSCSKPLFITTAP